MTQGFVQCRLDPDSRIIMTETPLKVIFLADTRPGHYHLAQGVIAAIERLRPVEVTRIEVKRKWIVPTRWLRAPHQRQDLLPAAHAAHGLSHRRLRIAESRSRSLGRRRNTYAEYLRVALSRGIPSIFCGSLLRGLGPENFSLIVSSYDRDAAAPRHMVVLKPSSIDPDALGRPAIVPRYGPALHPKLAGLLIGGNAGPFRYRRKEWERLLAFIAEISQAHGARAGWFRPRAARRIRGRPVSPSSPR